MTRRAVRTCSRAHHGERIVGKVGLRFHPVPPSVCQMMLRNIICARMQISPAARKKSALWRERIIACVCVSSRQHDLLRFRRSTPLALICIFSEPFLRCAASWRRRPAGRIMRHGEMHARQTPFHARHSYRQIAIASCQSMHAVSIFGWRRLQPNQFCAKRRQNFPLGIGQPRNRVWQDDCHTHTRRHAPLRRRLYK